MKRAPARNYTGSKWRQTILGSMDLSSFFSVLDSPLPIHVSFVTCTSKLTTLVASPKPQRRRTTLILTKASMVPTAAKKRSLRHDRSSPITTYALSLKILSGEHISIKLIGDTFVVDYRSEFVNVHSLSRKAWSPKWNLAQNFGRQIGPRPKSSLASGQ